MRLILMSTTNIVFACQTVERVCFLVNYHASLQATE